MNMKKAAVLTVIAFGALLTMFSARTKKEVAKRENNRRGFFQSYNMKAECCDSVDLLVMGDSESYTSVSPMQLWEEQGITANVCGQPGQKIQNTYFMLRTALRIQSPKILLLETNLMFREPGPVAEIHAVLRKSLQNGISDFKYQTYQKTVNKGKWAGELCYKGFVIRGGVSPFHSGDYMKKKEKAAEIPGSVLNYMGAIRALCRRQGIQLVLFSAPSPKNYNYMRHNAIVSYAEKYGIPYVDLNLQVKELGMNWKTDSYDKGDHLNLHGAKKVTAWVGRYMKNSGGLTDHRGELAYRTWDEELQKYRESIKKFTL